MREVHACRSFFELPKERKLELLLVSTSMVTAMVMYLVWLRNPDEKHALPRRATLSKNVFQEGEFTDFIENLLLAPYVF